MPVPLRVLYLRVSVEVDDFVRGVADRSGMTISETADLLLRASMTGGVSRIERGAPVIEREGKA